MAELSDKQDRSDTPSPEEPSSAQGPDHNEAFLNAEQKAHVRHMAKAVFDYIEALGVETNRVGQDKHSQYIATHGPIDSPEKQHEFHVEVAKHLEIATAQKRIEAHLLDQYHQRWCLQAAKILLVGVAHSIRYAMWHVDSEKAADSFANFYENQNNPRHQFIRSLLHTDHVVAVQTHALLNDLDNPNSNLGKKASESEALRLNVDRYKRTMSALAVWNEQIDLLGSELADLREERSNPETPTEYKAPDDRSYLQYIMSGWQREIREVLTEAVLMANTFLLEHFFELYNSGTVSHLTYWPVYATPHNKSPAKFLKEIDPLIFSGMKDIFPSLFTEKYIRQRRVAVPTNIPEPMISSFVEKMTT
ncbi:MAG: hypothetical protein KDD62_00235, partial [Bdellovibrionales bacterium]|nr:hypothetical protein [Bdellovibrionales bacterium]